MDTRPALKNFIVFEGIDGSGTTTQLARLSARLGSMGIWHAAEAEPTGGPVGILVRKALSGAQPLLPDTVARLFAADRGEHLYGPGGVAERCRAGQLVISDRYLFSSLAYQGLACGEELPRALNAAFPLPELTVFFHIDPEASMARLASRPGRDIYETMDFQRRVAKGYQTVMSAFDGGPMRLVSVDASMSPDTVEEAVWQAVAPIAERLISCR